MIDETLYILDSTGNKVEITIEEIVSELENLINDIDWAVWDATWDEGEEYTGEPYPVRLRIHEGLWEMLSGSPDYDTDHRGLWGVAYLTPEDHGERLTVVASELIESVE